MWQCWRRGCAVFAFCVLTVMSVTACGSGITSKGNGTPNGAGGAQATSEPVAYTVVDAGAMRKLTIAYILNGNVWVSAAGAAPRQVTSFTPSQTNGLQGAVWSLAFSPDASHLLAATYGSNSAGNWLIDLSHNTVTPISTSLVNCVSSLAACQWIDNRFVAYPLVDTANNQSTCGSRFSEIGIYDSQVGNDISTTLSGICTNTFEVRNDGVYFAQAPVIPATPGATSTPSPTLPDNVIQRYAAATNSLSAAFTTPMPLYINGLPSAAWDLSGDGTAVILSSGRNPNCAGHNPSCFVYYEANNTSNALFSQLGSLANGASCYSSARISPDGKSAALTLMASASPHCQNALLQQAMPNGAQQVNTMPASVDVLGWMPDNSGIIARTNTLSLAPEIDLFEAPLNSGGSAHIIAAVPAWFAIAGINPEPIL